MIFPVKTDHQANQIKKYAKVLGSGGAWLQSLRSVVLRIIPDEGVDGSRRPTQKNQSLSSLQLRVPCLNLFDALVCFH